MRDRNNWLASRWRPFAAVVYLAICITDFIALPVYYEFVNARLTAPQSVALAVQLEGGTAQIEALRVLREQRTWAPITLAESGLLHVAFGAILGVAAWTRGREKIERVRQSGNSEPTTPSEADNG